MNLPLNVLYLAIKMLYLILIALCIYTDNFRSSPPQGRRSLSVLHKGLYSTKQSSYYFYCSDVTLNIDYGLTLQRTKALLKQASVRTEPQTPLPRCTGVIEL